MLKIVLNSVYSSPWSHTVAGEFELLKEIQHVMKHFSEVVSFLPPSRPLTWNLGKTINHMGFYWSGDGFCNYYSDILKILICFGSGRATGAWNICLSSVKHLKQPKMETERSRIKLLFEKNIRKIMWPTKQPNVLTCIIKTNKEILVYKVLVINNKHIINYVKLVQYKYE